MKDLVPLFKNLVGFGEDPNFDNLIQEEDKESESGLFFQECHPLVNLTNIKAVSPLINKVEMDDTQFLRWLRIKEESAILKVLLGVRLNRNLARIERNFLDKSLIFDGGGNVKDMEIKEGRFVGFQLVIKNADQLVVTMNQICLQMSEVQKLKIYFYHSTEKNAVFVKEYQMQKSNLPNWIEAEDLDLISAKSQLFGGYWMIGYYEDDLVGQSLNKTGFNFILGGCNCGGINHWKQWNPFLSLQPICVANNNIRVDRQRPSDANFIYEKEKTYGINLMFSVGCSTKNIFLNQKEKFSQAIQLQFCVDMLHEIAYNTRTSAISEKLQQKAMYDLEDKESSIGLKTRLEKEIKSININLEKLGPICMPSDSKITYSTT